MGPTVALVSRHSTRAGKLHIDGHEEAQEDSAYINLLESIRATFAKSSIGALFSSPRLDQDPSSNTSASQESASIDATPAHGNVFVPSSASHRTSFFGDARRIIKDISPSRLRSRAASLSNGRTVPQAGTATRSRSHSIHQISASSSRPHVACSDERGLCMLSDSGIITSDSSSSQNSSGISGFASLNKFRPEDEGYMRLRRESEMIRAGKQPERPNVGSFVVTESWFLIDIYLF